MSLVLLSWVSPYVYPQSELPLEYRVKAAYLYNFLKFVHWPEDVFEDTDDPIRICVVGQNPFHGALNQLTERTAAGRPLDVRTLRFGQSFADCQLVYIGSGSAREVSDALERARLLPILTVSDQDEFAERGGVIGFVILDQKVRLEINLAAARAAGLQISAKLLEVARIVE